MSYCIATFRTKKACIVLGYRYTHAITYYEHVYKIDTSAETWAYVILSKPV